MNPVLPSGSFLGQVEKQCDQAGFVFSESVYRSRESLPMHQHARAFFFFVVEGSCLDICDDRTTTALNGTLVFHPAGQNHANEWACGGRCFHIELPPPLLTQFEEPGGAFTKCSVFERCPATLLSQSLRGEFHSGDRFAPLMMEGLAIELLATVARVLTARERRPPQWLLRIREILHEEFSRPICLSRIAAVVGVHPAHLSRAFRRHFGRTPGDYLRRVRVDAAAELLRASPLSIGEVAAQVGFSDQSHLTRTFLRERRVSPAAYRRVVSAQK